MHDTTQPYLKVNHHRLLTNEQGYISSTETMNSLWKVYFYSWQIKGLITCFLALVSLSPLRQYGSVHPSTTSEALDTRRRLSLHLTVEDLLKQQKLPESLADRQYISPKSYKIKETFK
jgi:hypothetical protein